MALLIHSNLEIVGAVRPTSVCVCVRAEQIAQVVLEDLDNPGGHRYTLHGADLGGFIRVCNSNRESLHIFKFKGHNVRWCSPTLGSLQLFGLQKLPGWIVIMVNGLSSSWYGMSDV